ncbi:MAG: hypothetical protein UX57_C0007G0003 [Candidatus Uhrbacteria bacterium GW2011_GWE2_46_68]|uniref:Uncharacterized protein n=1 Tax=Candidatus Uhrbacteria bacterium GW2011_GWE2_46_68 TaxID=1618994 RepID=A0A0G1Q7D0_9BACT|nr:MAG: hypothetical protein UX57_C0007G0003 [Candidatus Uhrbacteria bacterium GW2011_GWE2_46_68]
MMATQRYNPETGPAKVKNVIHAAMRGRRSIRRARIATDDRKKENISLEVRFKSHKSHGKHYQKKKSSNQRKIRDCMFFMKMVAIDEKKDKTGHSGQKWKWGQETAMCNRIQSKGREQLQKIMSLDDARDITDEYCAITYQKNGKKNHNFFGKSRNGFEKRKILRLKERKNSHRCYEKYSKRKGKRE